MTFEYQGATFFAQLLRHAREMAEHIRATPGAEGITKELIPLDTSDHPHENRPSTLG